MVLTFALILIVMLFILKPLQKNAFFMIYFALMLGAALLLERYGFRVRPFSKQAFFMFLPPHFIFINVVTFLAYMADKKAAVTKAWRVREIELHLLELLGGSPFAFLAQKLFHHKTKKKSFQMLFLFVLAIQISIIYYVIKMLGIF